jgi:hypothetical protein
MRKSAVRMPLYPASRELRADRELNKMVTKYANCEKQQVPGQEPRHRTGLREASHHVHTKKRGRPMTRPLAERGSVP